MKRLALYAACFLGAVLAGCGGGGTSNSPECSSNDDCVVGFLCIEEKCEPRDPVAITTESLPDATADTDYTTVVVAEGGQEPYQWSLPRKPGWMSIEPDTGHIRGTPGDPATGVMVTVRVEDATGGRDSSDEKTFTIDVASCAEGQTVVCYEVQDQKCMVGRKTCHNGQFGPCGNLDFSIETEKCGPQCGPCEENRADACKQGSCACGDGGACSAPDICCDGSCVDGSGDGNCGACGRVCSEAMAHSASPRCQDGQCVSDGCLPGWLDCDGDSQNGCESGASVDNCGACGADCSAVEHVGEVVCEVGQDGAACGYSGNGTTGEGCELGWYDCDGDRSNGCETQVDDNNCGGCALACSSQCLLHPDGDHYYCGCTTDDDCGGNGLCCTGECFLNTDPRHCGSCTNDCTTQVQNAPATCSAGQCGHGQCEAGWLDCDNNAANGCELAMDDMNCGSCGFACGANAACDTASGTCTCTDNFADCMGGWTDGCETDITSSPQHCGTCGHDCDNDLQHVSAPLCTGSNCDYTACENGFGDCDSDRSNGCEEGIWETADCGTNCTNRVDCNDAIMNAIGPGCVNGSCDYQACVAGYENCDGSRSNGCEENIWETADCGTTCNNRLNCSQQVQNASGVKCDHGICDYTSCVSGYQSCDGDRTNGCEENIWETSDCGTTCNNRLNCSQQVQNASGVKCDQGTCDYTSCVSGYQSCDGDRTNGCEINIQTNPQNCGSCGNDCGQNSVCNQGSCDCMPGYANCDGGWNNGCETDIWQISSCGTTCNNGVDCTQQVQNANGIFCNQGQCDYSSCKSYYGNCDDNRANGCEASLLGNQNCGGCGHTCNCCFGQCCNGYCCGPGDCRSSPCP